MNMKKKYILSAVVATLSLSVTAQSRDIEPAYQFVNKDTICNIFIYSPSPDRGLHLAYLGSDEKYHEIGQLLSSDYGPWGSDKKMYTPFVAQAKDGTWRALWSVNKTAPTFAVAYSEDLINWRPQDYPIVKEKGVSNPVAYEMEDASWDIYIKTSQGKRYLKGDKDFRHFKEDSLAAEADEILWEQDEHEVDGKAFKGNDFEVPPIYIRYARDWFHALANENKGRDIAVPQKLEATLRIDNNKSKSISSNLMGIFFEDISYAADGGLWAELLQNGDFEYNKEDRNHRWNAGSYWKVLEAEKAKTSEGGKDKQVVIETVNPLSLNNEHYAIISQNDILENEGWDGIVDEGSNYVFSTYVKNIDAEKNQLNVSLVSEGGDELASDKIKIEGTGWQKLTIPLSTVSKKRPAGKLNMTLRLSVKKEGRIGIDLVSLIPQETFHHHGLRKDLADTIAALQPKFVRFPGGCMSHGDGIDNIYNWKESIGPVQDRKPVRNIWGYHQSRRLGFYEYFQWCEDMGAEPLPVLAAGVPCQNSGANAKGIAGQQGGIPFAKDAKQGEKTMESYIQDVLDLIDYANGDPSKSKWAKMRADAGHPAPFNLKMIGIGNEDLISTVFEERYLAISRAVKAKYPNIKVIGTAGPFHYPSSDYVEGWKLAKSEKTVDGRNLFYAIDEHYYEQPQWFMNHQDYYDNYDRKAPKVYLGEYASRGRNAKYNAVVEALYLINIERNADVVDMTSYAPLLSKDGHSNWSPDMIYFSNDTIRTSPSYHVQKLFSTHSGDTYIDSSLQLPENMQNLNKYIGISVVRDSKTGHTWLKIANTLPCKLVVKSQSDGKEYPVDGESIGVFPL